MLTMISNHDEDKGLVILNFFPVFKTDTLNEKGEKARRVYNKSLLAFAIWLIVALACYVVFNS